MNTDRDPNPVQVEEEVEGEPISFWVFMAIDLAISTLAMGWLYLLFMWGLR